MPNKIFKYIFIVFLAFSFFGIFGHARADITTGLVGHWKLDESSGDAADSSGNGFTGIRVNGPAWQPSGGIINGALQFDGNDDYLRVDDPGISSKLDFGNGDSITLAAWVKPDTLSKFGTILVKGDVTGSYDNINYMIQADDDAGLWFGYIDSTNTRYNIYGTTNNVFTLSQWHHVAVTYTFGMASSMKIYINGSLVPGIWGVFGAGMGNDVPLESNANLWLGNDDYNNDGIPDEGYDGRIDDVRIYNYAINQETINSLHAMGSPPPAYDFDDLYSFSDQAGANDYWLLSSDVTTATNYADHEAQAAENVNGGLWCWTDTGSPSGSTGPPPGTACIYTETSTSGTGKPVAGSQFFATLRNPIDAGQYGLYVTFNTVLYGDTTGTVYFEAWDGVATWDVIDTFTGDSNTTFTSRGPYDLTSYDNSDFKIRFRTVVGTGNVYQNDFAIDEVHIYGDAKAPPVAHIVLSPTIFTFNGVSGGATPPGQTLNISNTGNAALSWIGTTDQGWCHLSSASGNIAAGNNQNITVSVDAPSNVGSFPCTVTISDAAADNSPQTADVTYDVVAGSCGSGSVILNPATINVGGTSAASAPADFTGGSFSSSNSGIASVSGSTVNGVSAGSATILGTGWTYTPTSASNCSLTGTGITVQAAGGSASVIVPAACADSDYTLFSTNDIYATVLGYQTATSTKTTIKVFNPINFDEDVTFAVDQVLDESGADVSAQFPYESFEPPLLKKNDYLDGSEFMIGVAGDTAQGIYTIYVKSSSASVADHVVVVKLYVDLVSPEWIER